MTMPAIKSRTEAPASLDRHTLVIASVVILGALMSILDATVVNVALQTLTRELHTPLPTIQWVVSGYTLALACALPVSGWAADRFGGRRVWLAAVAVFTLGSLASGLAWSSGSLIAFRLLQGLGGGVLAPVGTIIIARAAGVRRMGQVMALMGLPLLLGPVLGPVVGGALVEGASWRWIFFINLPIGIAAIALGARLLPRENGSPAGHLDVIGLLLLSPALAAIVYGLSRVHAPSDITSPPVVVSGLGGLALIAAFTRRSLRVESPLIDVRLFRQRTFAASSLSTSTLALASFGAMLLLPLYLQQVRGEDVLMTGLLTTPQAVGMALSMTAAGRVADRIGAGYVVPVGLAVSAASLAGMTFLTATTSYWTLGALIFATGVGFGASLTPTMSAAYASLDGTAVSRATTELQIVQRVGSTIGVALFAVVLGQRLGHRGRPTPSHAASAFAGTYWWALALTAVAFVPAYFLPRTKAPAVEAVPEPSVAAR